MKPENCVICEFRKEHLRTNTYCCTKVNAVTGPHPMLSHLHNKKTPSWCPLGADESVIDREVAVSKIEQGITEQKDRLSEESKPISIKEAMKQVEEKMDKSLENPDLGKFLQDWIDLPTITASEWEEKLKNGETDLDKKYKIGVEKYIPSEKGLYGITPIPLSAIPPYSLITIAQANNKSGTMQELEENYNRIIELLKKKP